MVTELAIYSAMVSHYKDYIMYMWLINVIAITQSPGHALSTTVCMQLHVFTL